MRSTLISLFLFGPLPPPPHPFLTISIFLILLPLSFLRHWKCLLKYYLISLYLLSYHLKESSARTTILICLLIYPKPQGESVVPSRCLIKIYRINE
jgi:hypothetical protein